jgi:hypothetical protein
MFNFFNPLISRNVIGNFLQIFDELVRDVNLLARKKGLNIIRVFKSLRHFSQTTRNTCYDTHHNKALYYFIPLEV